MNDKISSDDFKEQISASDPDTERVRVKLSKLIENHHLDAKDKMNTLTRLSANIINELRRNLATQSTKDGSEELFYYYFDASLEAYGLHGLIKSMVDIERRYVYWNKRTESR